MATFDVLSLFGVNIDFSYFNAFELVDTLGLHSQVLGTARVGNLIEKHGEKHHIVSIAIRQVALSELKGALENRMLPHDPSFYEQPTAITEYERRYEAEDKLILLCFSLAFGKSVVGVRRLEGAQFSKLPRELLSKKHSLYQYFRQLLNDNTREYVLSYKEGKVDSLEPSETALSFPSTNAVEQSQALAKPVIEPVTFAKEVQTALGLMSQGVELITKQVKAVFAGRQLDLDAFHKYCHKLNLSYERNPNALLAVRHIQDTDDYIAQHGVACAILACHMGRALQLDERFVHVMTLGALLFDLGRFKLPELITKKTGKLTEAEFQLVRRHLNFGEVLLNSNDNVPKVIYQMLWEHHERMDGSGYPQGKIDHEISVYGKIGAIVDAYDSLTSEQSHRQALTPVEALDKMQIESGLAFDPKLMSIFVNSLGSVPVGSCVELSNGRLAFVLTLNNALEPSLIRQVYSLTSKTFIPPTDLPIDKGEDVLIARTVSPSSYGLRFIDHIG